jgi:hypothetical protein
MVQYGEWKNAFKPKYSAEFWQDLTDKLNKGNIITTTARQNRVNAFYQLLVDLGRFKSDRFALNSIITPFECFYPHYIRKIQSEVKTISRTDLAKYIEDKIAKEEHGEQYKAAKNLKARQ